MRRTPPKPRRQADPDRDYWERMRALLYRRAGGRCEGQVTEECRSKRGDLNVTGMQAHHRKLRSQGGGHSIVNLAGLCPDCHRWAHDHPAEARLRGLICPRYHDPATWAMTLPSGRIVVLNRDAGYGDVMDAPDPEQEPA